MQLAHLNNEELNNKTLHGTECEHTQPVMKHYQSYKSAYMFLDTGGIQGCMKVV